MFFPFFKAREINCHFPCISGLSKHFLKQNWNSLFDNSYFICLNNYSLKVIKKFKQSILFQKNHDIFNLIIIVVLKAYLGRIRKNSY